MTKGVGVSGWDIAQAITLLTVTVGGLWTAIKWFLSRGDSREERLTARERVQWKEMEDDLRRMKSEVAGMRGAYFAMLSVMQVMVDHMIVTNPRDPALATLAENLRIAFPEPSNMPHDMAALLRRIDGRPSKETTT